MTDNANAAEPTAPEMDPSPLDQTPQGSSERSPEDMAIAGKVEEHLLDVIDPELGINVIDLGLVYDLWIEDKKAVMNMTLTSPACPLQDVLEDQARDAVLSNVEEVTDLQINWVWSPAWGPHMINEEGREQLRFLGFTV